MTLSDERINHLAHQVAKALKSAAPVSDETKILVEIKRAIHEFGSLLERLDLEVRQKIESLKRSVPEGSREWDILYKQYFGEATSKKGI